MSKSNLPNRLKGAMENDHLAYNWVEQMKLYEGVVKRGKFRKAQNFLLKTFSPCPSLKSEFEKSMQSRKKEKGISAVTYFLDAQLLKKKNPVPIDL